MKKLLRKKLALMLANSRKARPYYCEVEYLQSSGTQYIDLGLKGKNNLDFDYKVVFTQVDSNAQCVGGNWSLQTQSNQSFYFGLIRSNGNFAYHYDGTASPVVLMNTTQANTPYIVHGHLWKNEQYFVINGTKSNVGTISSTFVADINMWLFAVNSTTPIYSYAQLSFFKIYDNGALVRDMIPVLDWDFVPCMYDRITGQFFYNAGTGTFSYGREIHYVDYIESTGTQYIDTGIQPTDDYGYRIKHTYTAGGGEQCAIGCMDLGNRFIGIYTSGSSNAISGGWGSFVNFLPSYPWTTDTILDVKCNYKNSRKIIIDETEMKDISDIHITGTISNTIYLGARNYGSNITKMRGKIYGAEITNGQNVVADFTPAKDENDVGFMFDRLSHTIFDNAGSGSFITGNVVD